MKTQIIKLNTFSVDVLSRTGFCVSRDGDEVFISGKTGPLDQQVIQRYNRTGQLLNTWQVKCRHDFMQCLLHLSIGGTPYIAVSCWECNSIYLYSMTDSDPIKAFSDKGNTYDSTAPYAMCLGPDNTILASYGRGS